MCPHRSRRSLTAVTLLTRAAVVTAVVGACSAARPPAPELAALLEDLRSRARFAGVASSGAAFDPADGVDLREAQVAALVLHPTLRAARATAEGLKSVRDASPGFPNPTLDVAAQGVVESVPDPWKVSVGLGFSIPLSSRIDAETQLWDARHQEALWDVVALERRHQGRVRRQWVRWMELGERSRLLREHEGALAAIYEIASRLTDAGELSPAGLGLLAAQRRRTAREGADTASDAERAAMAVLRLIGLRPDAPVQLLPSWPTPGAGDRVADPTALPSVRAAQAAVVVARAAAEELAVRRAPDLTIGPTFEHDRGQNAVGAALSAPLPLFDRLERPRADAEARVRAATLRLEGALLDAEADLATARADVDAASARLARATASVAEVDGLIGRVEALVRSGEVELWIIGEALSERLDARLAELDARVALALALSSLEGLGAPMEAPR